MNEWKVSIQKIIDWIEINIENKPSLLEMSQKIGYSPYYCSYLFHQITGITLKSYIAGRRLCHATLELRDTNVRILDIALKYGYSSQEALTRALVNAYGLTPLTYRKSPKPVQLSIKQDVLSPEDYIPIGGNRMSNIKEPSIRFEYIPAHKYIGIWDIRVNNYCDFSKYHDCDEVCVIIESMRNVASESVGPHMAGWFYEAGKRGYFYGFGVPIDYNGEIPDGFEIKEFPASNYMVFFHPPFQYLEDNGEVMTSVEKLAWNYNPLQSDRWWIPGGYE
ncbi:helix-turn-helix domain-containing protein [Clostridium guangxiense]|uniref:helix-turn-helix domain-containing protein n=1 Tax=Clostridium guangxiense TaxID=1662055 RepID=UPI001E4C1A87|nr:helix-turn-helix domain-containing protein [Clostridium guangxiense]MCD2348063.1 AraC family transcriptional regulator [Clostridium guangxiense]